MKSAVIIFLLPLLLCADELSDFLKRAEEANPSVQAALQRAEQARQQILETEEFLDSSLYLAAGRTEEDRDMPLEPPNYNQLTGNSLELQGGVEIPLAQGAYVTTGFSTRKLYKDSAYEHLYQNLATLQLSIPLWRDRGFAVYSHRLSAARAEYEQSLCDLLAVKQNLRHQLELAYITAYETMATCRVKEEATERFRRLVKEAKELARLKTIPEYQVQETELELQIGLDDEDAAHNAHQLALVALATLLGSQENLELVGQPQALIDACALVPEQPQAPPRDQLLAQRGDTAALACQIRAARAQAERYEEEAKDSLFLSAGLSYLAESEKYDFHSYRKRTDDNLEGEISLTWRRSFGNRGARARQQRFEARVSELLADLSQAELNASSQLRQAEFSCLSARRRIDIVRQGIAAAEETVRAETQRFQLGEGSSKAVLDAQKNLTDILQRQTNAAADLLRAYADFRHAAGYGGEGLTP